jgi:hypothetical protein
VDHDIQESGYLPDHAPAHTNGNGHSNARNGHQGTNGSRRAQANGHSRNNGNGETWACSDKQRALITKIVDEHQLDNDIERLAQERFGKGVRQLNKMEASGPDRGAAGNPRRDPERPQQWRSLPEGEDQHRPCCETTAQPSAKPARSTKSIAELLATVSASRLNTFHTCRLKFYFNYVAGLPRSRAVPSTSVPPSTSPSSCGIWPAGESRPSRTAGCVSSSTCSWTDDQEGQIRWDMARGRIPVESLGVARHLDFQQSPIPANEAAEGVEVSVEADLGSTKLIGIIDLVRSGGRLVELGTTGQTPNPEKAEHLHELQCSCATVDVSGSDRPPGIGSRATPPGEAQGSEACRH